jgi:hypothetical protein
MPTAGELTEVLGDASGKRGTTGVPRRGGARPPRRGLSEPRAVAVWQWALQCSGR